MENLMEKIKGLDKKVLIGAGIGAAALIILIVVLVIGLGNKPAGNQDGTQPGTQVGTETENGVTEVIGTEDVTEEIGTEVTTETEMGTEVESESESQTQGIGGTTVTARPDVNGVTQKPVTTTPDGQEILGSGTKADPYLVHPVDMAVTTIEIPAGQTVYYSIYRAGGKYFTINDSAVSVVYNGRTYTAKSGKISFKVKNELASKPIDFQIKNTGSTAKSYVIKFSDPKGSWDNPESVSSIVNQSVYTVSVAAGADKGYWYTYKAEKTGTIRFYVTGSVPSGLLVQNSETKGGTDEASFAEAEHVKTDEQGRQYIEFAVTQGQVIKINVCAEQNSDGTYPASNITWEAKYA